MEAIWNAITYLERIDCATPEQRLAAAAELRAMLEAAPAAPKEDTNPSKWTVTHNGKSVTADTLSKAMIAAQSLRTDQEQRVAAENLLRRIGEEMAEEVPAAPSAPAVSDDDLWHIASVVTRLNGGSLFNVSQHECVTAIRASFMDPDAGRALLALSPQAPKVSAQDERETYTEWAEVFYRNADRFTNRDHIIGWAAWQARATLAPDADLLLALQLITEGRNTDSRSMVIARHAIAKTGRPAGTVITQDAASIRNAALEDKRDAEMLDWLEASPGFQLEKYITWRNGEDEYDGIERSYWQLTTKDDDEYKGSTLRAAIDAAMQDLAEGAGQDGGV